MEFKPSAKLTESENHHLGVLSSLLYAAPLNDAKYAEYKALCKKANRKAYPNW